MTEPTHARRPNAALVVYAASYVAVVVISVLRFGGHLGPIADTSGTPLGIAVGTLIVATFVWIHRAWSLVPVEERGMTGRTISPQTAVAYLFIPFFNIYWAFASNVALAGAWNRLNDRHVTPYRVSTWPVYLGAACAFAPICSIFVAPCAWIVFMIQVDRAARHARFDGSYIAETFV